MNQNINNRNKKLNGGFIIEKGLQMSVSFYLRFINNILIKTCNSLLRIDGSKTTRPTILQTANETFDDNRVDVIHIISKGASYDNTSQSKAGY